MDSDGSAVSPEEAFSLLGDETRTDVLYELWETDREPLAFGEIRDRLGSPDSGRLNYHLNELEGHLLARDDGGYRLTQAGLEVVRAIMAGTVTRRPAVDSVRIDGECVECGGTLVGRYDGRFVVECGDCGETVMWNEFPPAGLDDRTPAAAAVAFDRWTRHRFRLAMDGVCPNCAAEMAASVVDPDDGDPASEHRCPNCRYEARVPLFAHALYHPAAVSLLYEDGVDVARMPYWRLRALADDVVAQEISEDLWRVETTVSTDERSLTVTLDGDLEVLAVESEPR